jgi:hypothetical protein
MRAPLYFKKDPPALQRAQGNDEIGMTKHEGMKKMPKHDWADTAEI